MDESCREAKNDCVDTLVCLNSLCKPALKDGDRCEKSDHCVGSLVCRTDSHTCGEGHSDGETCKSDSDCRSPLKCVDTPGAHGGQVCENTEKEDSHDSAYQEGSGSKRPSGARCQSSTDCEEGL